MRDFFREAVFLCIIPLDRALSSLEINSAARALASSNFFELKAKLNFLDKAFSSDLIRKFLKRLFLFWRILLKADFRIGNFSFSFRVE